MNILKYSGGHSYGYLIWTGDVSAMYFKNSQRLA